MNGYSNGDTWAMAVLVDNEPVVASMIDDVIRSSYSVPEAADRVEYLARDMLAGQPDEPDFSQVDWQEIVRDADDGAELEEG